MTLLALEDFDPPIVAEPNAADPDDRLESFEAGYREGWEDAVKDATEARDRIRRTLAARLEDLAFTYEEARTGLLNQMEGVIAAVADAVVPALVREGFGESLLASIQEEVALRGAQGAVQLRVAPADLEGVRAILDVPAALPLELGEDPTLEAGQAIFSFDGVTRQIDHQALADTARRLLRERLQGNTHDERPLRHA